MHRNNGRIGRYRHSSPADSCRPRAAVHPVMAAHIFWGMLLLSTSAAPTPKESDGHLPLEFQEVVVPDSVCEHTLGCSSSWMGASDGCDCTVEGVRCPDPDCLGLPSPSPSPVQGPWGESICNSMPAACDGTFAGTELTISYPVTGTIPPELGQLAQLEKIWISGNSGPRIYCFGGFDSGCQTVFSGLSGTIPSELSHLSQLKELHLSRNALSGTIPQAMAQLSNLKQLSLWSNKRLSGTIPQELSQAPQLTELSLGDNTISGTLPRELGQLSQLTYLDVGGNALSGTLPLDLSLLTQLTSLGLGDNSFSYPLTAEGQAALAISTQVCRSANLDYCDGVPPFECSAFLNAYQSISNPNAACVICEDGETTTVAIIITILAVVGAVAIIIFIRLVVRYPSATTRWVSTVAILINHAQTAGIIAGLRLGWPHSLSAMAAALRLNFAAFPQVSCLFKANFVSGSIFGSFGLYTLVSSAIVLVSLLGPLVAKAIASLRGWTAHADSAEFVLSIIYSLTFTFTWGLLLDCVYGLYTLGIAPSGNKCTGSGNGPLGTLCTDGALMVIFAGIVFLLLPAVAVRFARNILFFKRGFEGGHWRSPGWFTWCKRGKLGRSIVCPPALCTDRPIFPRRLERQVAYLTGRFARHAPLWQLFIWLRQLLLLLVAFAGDMMFDALSERNYNTARYALAVVAIAITFVFWFAQLRIQPYAYRFQNALESWLYGATALLIALALIYMALPVDPAELRIVVEVAIAATLIGSLIVGAIFSIRGLRRTRQALASIDLSDALANADAKIDGSLAERLRDGSVRLLRCSWLASPASNASLGRSASTGAVIMKRRQDLPPEAFVPCEEAAEMLERGDRSILSLSYGWLTALHPDPQGTTLAAVRRFLKADEATATSDLGLFWDFCSLPQRGPNGEKKTDQENVFFKRGLEVMGSFYASVTGTAVIQQRKIVLPPGATSGFGPGEYNPTPYEGDAGRGWCIFEQATCMTVLAHLTAAEKQAKETGKALPQRFGRAQASRAKVYDIAGDAPVARECSLPPKEVLDAACRAIEKARFTGKADKVMVPQMLAEFEWIFRNIFEQALEDHAASGVTVRRKDIQAAIGRNALAQP